MDGGECGSRPCWYSSEREEVFVLADAIQLKQQKATRGEAGAEPRPQRAMVHVNTGVTLVPGKGGCLSAVKFTGTKS